MKKTLIYLTAVALLGGCRSRTETLTRQQQQYAVVPEGQTSGVTSTINAPGEVPQPPAAMTATNADTTSQFALTQTALTASSTSRGTIAGTLPATSTDTPRPKPTPRPQAPTPAPEPASTSTNVEPPAVTSTIPPSTDTAPPPPPQSTDTQAPPATTTT